jgi:4-amino-4-deoxy-L-arabinose transferase-like glycosyltransferase
MPVRGSFKPVPQFSPRTARIILAIVLLAGLWLRLSWALRQPTDDAALERLPDQREYLSLGSHLFHDGLWFADPRFAQIIYAYRTPGYPFLIALCGAKPTIVRIAQCVLDTSTILAIYLLAGRWLSHLGALVAATLVAVNPYMIFFTGTLLSETLFTSMLCWGLVILVLSDGPWPDGNKLLLWLGAGFILALSVLVRPGTLLMPVLLGCGAALANCARLKSYPSHWPLPIAATMLLLTALVLFPWAARNRWVLGSWIWTSTNDGITRYDGFNPDATGASDQKFIAAMPWTSDMSEVARSRYFTEMADDWIEAHPLEAVRLAGLKVARTWSPMPLSQEYGNSRLYKTVGLVWGIPFDLLILLGLRQRILSGSAKRLLLLPAIYFTIAAGLSVGSLRYRVPAEGPMAVLAAGALPFARRTQKAILQTEAQ